MNNLTPQQNQQLTTFAEKRDVLLREIGNLSVQREGIEKSCKDGGAALTDINNQIAEARGRLAELVELETRWRGSVSTDIMQLEVTKTRLQGEVSLLEEKVKGGEEKYAIVIGAGAELEKAHIIMQDQAAIVNKVVGEIIITSQTHTSEMKTIMDNIRVVSLDVIEKGNANIAQADSLMVTVPRFVESLQKSIASRRVYPEGHPKFIKTQ